MVSTNINEQILRISVALLLLSVAAVSEARPIKKAGHNYKAVRSHAHFNGRVNSHFGRRVTVLNPGYISLNYGGLDYYFTSGVYYRRYGRDYVSVRPPVGIGIHVLPRGYRSFRHNHTHYYFADGVYYRWNDFRRKYIVVDAPPVTQESSIDSQVSQQFVYPAQGQSTDQTSLDRYECYLWSVQQTGVEPAQHSSTTDQKALNNYQRANGACLEARGYSVN